MSTSEIPPSPADTPAAPPTEDESTGATMPKRHPLSDLLRPATGAEREALLADLVGVLAWAEARARHDAHEGEPEDLDHTDA